jgi:pantoate--beta-alanine ligase
LIEAEPLARVDYVEAVDPLDLDSVAEIRGDVLIALAVFVGSTRLIDNIRVRV